MTPDAALEPIELPKNPIPSTAGMTTRVVKGSIWTLGGQIAPFAVSFIATPFTVRYLGSEGYGVLILLGLIPAYLTFADFGMSLAATKFGSEAYSNGEKEGEGLVIRTASLIAISFVVPIAAALFFFSSQIAEFFNIPLHLQGEASLALKLTSATLVMTAVSGIFSAPLLARLRMDLNTLVNAVPKILMSAATPVVLYLGGGLVGAVLVGFIGALVVLVGQLFFARRLLPELFRLSIDPGRISALLRFGGGWLIASAAIMLLGNIEKFFLSKLTDMQSLAHYSVAATLAMMATMLPLAMTQSLVPAFAQLSSSQKFAELRNLFSRSVRFNVLWLLPAAAVGFIFVQPFLKIWLGDEFANAGTVPFYILLIGVFVNVVAYVPWAVLISAGKTSLLGGIYFAEFLLYSVFAWLLISRYGIYGAAAAWSTRIALDGSLLFLLSNRFFQTRIGLFEWGRGLLLSIAILSLPIYLRIFYYDSWWLIGSASIVCLAGYAIAAWRFLLTADERTKLVGVINRYLSFLKLNERFAK